VSIHVFLNTLGVEFVNDNGSQDSSFVPSSRAESTINSNLRRYVLCYDELTPVKINQLNPNDVKEFDGLLMALEDIM
jgi:hypothetical protein